MGVLLSALLPFTRPLIEQLVKGVEKIFGAKTGDVKRESVLAAIMPIIEALAKAGKIPGLPDAATTTAMVEMVVQDLKKTGDLSADGGSKTITVPLGAKITIEL